MLSISFKNVRNIGKEAIKHVQPMCVEIQLQKSVIGHPHTCNSVPVTWQIAGL